MLPASVGGGVRPALGIRHEAPRLGMAATHPRGRTQTGHHVRRTPVRDRFSHRPPQRVGLAPSPGSTVQGRPPHHSVGGFWAQAWQRGPRPPLLTLVQGFVLTCLRKFKTFPDHPAHTRVHLKTYAQSTKVS